MPVNWSENLYKQTQDIYSRVIVVTPRASTSGGAPYAARGILDIEAIEVGALDGSIVSETRIVLDIRDSEFAVAPAQGDLIDIPGDSGLPVEGPFEVVDSDPNGGGETTLVLRRVVAAKP
jgi:hypothetical protein